MPQKKNPLDAEEEEQEDAPPQSGKQTRENIRKKNATRQEELIYDASERGGCYHCIRVLWCGCFEPYAHITTKYVKEDRWEGCAKKSDSMAFENILDVQRQQTCCCLMASFMPCCCCIEDMGDIILFGSDASEQKKSKKDVEPTFNPSAVDPLYPDKWVLKRVSNSFETFEKITGHLQDIHAGWRMVGRNLGRKIHQVV
eukprot:34089_1